MLKLQGIILACRIFIMCVVLCTVGSVHYLFVEPSTFGKHLCSEVLDTSQI